MRGLNGCSSIGPFMPSPALLLAETDHHTLDILPRILSDRIPHLLIDICTSVDDLSRKLKGSSYDLVATNSVLIHHYRTFKKRPDQLLAPCIVTANEEDRAWASTVLQGDAFDLIVKPIVPDQAVHTVNLALWHHRFLQLLASRERAVSRFQEHMAAFPHDRKAEGELMEKLAIFERTLQAVRTSMQHLLPTEKESALFDMASTIEHLTRERALDRLLTLCKEGATH